ncbi:MAG: alpha/beta fold hydrolase [Deltaproteobacteria bacterium]|nr:MAG: alpha/beta fold hydrolase [Deltaproteobacteria bacterium]
MTDEQLYPFAAKKISIDGHDLSFLDQGQGKVIIMLHGNPTWSFYYRNLVKQLQESYRVIVPDHMGCGYSDKPQDYPYTLKTHIDNLETLLTELNIDKFSLVLHDWGGAIGMGLAVRKPEKVESIVVLNTAAFRSQRIPLRISLCRIPLIGDIIVRGFNGFARAALTMAVTHKMEPEVARGYLKPYDSWSHRIAVLRFVQDIPLTPKDPSWQTLMEIESGLTQFQNTPMLILWGGKDFCFNRHFYDEWLQRFPNAESHFLPDAGHYVLEDSFMKIAPLVSTFFQKQGKYES